MSSANELPTSLVKLRSLQVGNDWPAERVGGLNRYFSEVLRFLPGVGVGVRGLVVGPKHLYEDTQGVVTPFASSQDPIYKRLYCVRREAKKILESSNVDLIVSHFALYTPSLSLRLGEIPLVVHFHGPWAAESNVENPGSRHFWMKHALEAAVYRRAKRFITLSRSFQLELTKNFGVDERITRVIPGGIDLQRFSNMKTRREARLVLGWPSDRPIMLAVRRMVRRMGLETLIDAMQSVVAARPDVLLLLGGKGPLSAELECRVRERNLQRNIEFLGRIPEETLAIAYRAADMTVVPSLSLEGFGMITLESLASGTPALVTPIGGLPEIVLPFAPQCVFADTSTPAIADLLCNVLSGKTPLPTDDACRQYAENFSWHNICKELAAFYEEALA